MLPNLNYLLSVLSVGVALSTSVAQNAAPGKLDAPAAATAEPAAATAEPAAATGEPAAAGEPAAQAKADGFVSAVRLLPETTGGYLRAVDLPSLCKAWDKTTLSNLGTDPAMKPFWDAQEATAERQLEAGGLKVGLTLNDLYDVSSGEIVLGWLSYPDPKRPYTVCLVTDIRGRRQRADKALATLDENMKARQATRKDLTHQGQTIRLYTLPKAPGQFKIEQIAITLNDERLLASDRDSTIQRLLDTLADPPTPAPLADAADHLEIWKQVGDSEPAEVQWFIRPLAFARIMREIAGTDRGQRVDIVKLLERQGFAAVKSTGGRVQVAEQSFDLLHHGYIYAPQDPNSKTRFELAARMLDFPNTQASPLPNWIDTETSTCARLSWNMKDAFWAAETLVDDAFGSEIFRPTLEGIKEDVEGPQIDIPNNVIAHFDNELFHLTDSVNADSDRTLVAVRLKNTATVAKAINKAMESEPDASRIEESPEHPIWKVVPNADVEFDDDNFGEFGFGDDFEDEDEEDQPKPLLEQWAITVIEDPSLNTPGGGYLIFSSHAAQLVETVNRIRQQQPGQFEQQPDVQQVIQQILQLGGQQRSMANIDRTKRSWRIKYKLLREGTLRDSDSILGNLIRRANERRKDTQEDPDLNASKLPPFGEIEQFLNPGGGFMQTEENGWRLRNFLLK